MKKLSVFDNVWTRVKDAHVRSPSWTSSEHAELLATISPYYSWICQNITRSFHFPYLQITNHADFGWFLDLMIISGLPEHPSVGGVKQKIKKNTKFSLSQYNLLESNENGTKTRKSLQFACTLYFYNCLYFWKCHIIKI